MAVITVRWVLYFRGSIYTRTQRQRAYSLVIRRSNLQEHFISIPFSAKFDNRRTDNKCQPSGELQWLRRNFVII